MTRTRGYAHSIDARVGATLAWQACTEERWLRRWCAAEAYVEPRVGGTYRVRVRDGRLRDATIDIWDVGRRLRLIHQADAELADLPGAATVGPLVEDVLFDARPGYTAIRVLGSGVPADRTWDPYYERLRLSWTYWLRELKLALEAGAAPAVRSPGT